MRASSWIWMLIITACLLIFIPPDLGTALVKKPHLSQNEESILRHWLEGHEYFRLGRNSPLAWAKFPQAHRPRKTNDLQALQSSLDCFSKQGRWTYNPVPRWLPWPSIQSFCDMRHAEKGGIWGLTANTMASSGNADAWRVRESLKYEWIVNETCGAFEEVDKEAFCRVLKQHGDILIVGDSISSSLHESLCTHLSIPGREPELVQAPYCPLMRNPKDRRNYCNVVEVCQEEDRQLNRTIDGSKGQGKGENGKETERPVHIRFIRNDHLSTHHISWSHLPFLHFDYKLYNISVLVLNQGAHYWSNENFTAALRNVMENVREHYPDLLIIYRTTPPGHVNCTRYKKPLEVRQNREDVHRQHPDYHWANFTEQNVLARPIVEELGGIYMDVDDLTALRPDVHIEYKPHHRRPDCLHFCQPGPVDVWAKLLFNIILAFMG